MRFYFFAVFFEMTEKYLMILKNNFPVEGAYENA